MWSVAIYITWHRPIQSLSKQLNVKRANTTLRLTNLERLSLEISCLAFYPVRMHSYIDRTYHYW